MEMPKGGPKAPNWGFLALLGGFPGLGPDLARNAQKGVQKTQIGGFLALLGGFPGLGPDLAGNDLFLPFLAFFGPAPASPPAQPNFTPTVGSGASPGRSRAPA